MKTEHRNALVIEVAVVAPHPILHRMRAWKRMLTQEAQQIELALEFVLALDLVDAEQKAALRGLEEIVAVDRTLRNRGKGTHPAHAVIIGKFLEERFGELSINGHLIGDERLGLWRPA